jgi:HAD superfamily hydrolase (TIGR01509 family)
MIMTSLPCIFLDDGGTLNDNRLRAPQWRELIADFFVPRFGGSREQWKEANTVAFRQFLQNFEEKYSNRLDYDYIKALNEEDILWLTAMFEHVGLRLPPYSKRLSLARESQLWITPRVKAAIPGIVTVIKTLSKRFPLNTSSGGPSWLVRATLEGMGLNSYFTHLYGPDLVNTPKNGAIFYEKILKDANVRPGDVIVVEDVPKNLAMAKELGATVIQSCATGEFEPEFPLHYQNPSELLDLILKLANPKSRGEK